MLRTRVLSALRHCAASRHNSTQDIVAYAWDTVRVELAVAL
ncbi:hypothetical protein RR48_15471 [Papilio machaon]|uniref:Uncharacterized protein n=1 Tax=Papilio machaon TaxID=76193 RepID=A0A194QWJ2_PAPMA|nr:hypothetical protein RR48_15471 [Papilio machaon]